MKSASSTALLFLTTLAISSSAWPLIPVFQHQKREPQSYSVVPVDGGNTAGTSAPATKTITDAVTQVRTSVITSLSTIIVTQSNIPSTTVVPQTITIATTIISPASAPAAAPPVTVPTSVTIPVTVSANPATVTVSPLVTSSAYDNGQWHTIYYSVSTVAEESPAVQVAAVSSMSTSAVTVDAAIATSSAIVDPASWQSWSNKTNNGLWTPSR